MSSEPTPSEALLAAVRAGETATVEGILATDPALAATRDAAGVSVLLLALYAWQPEIAATIRAAGLPLDVLEAVAVGDADRLHLLLAEDPGRANAWSADGFAPLHLAAFFGGPEVTAILLSAGAEPGTRSRNDFAVMPLHSAVAAGRGDIALLLLAAGADPSVRQRHGWTPLHGAAENGLGEVVDALLAAGADPRATIDDGRDAADLATARGHLAIAERIRAAR